MPTERVVIPTKARLARQDRVGRKRLITEVVPMMPSERHESSKGFAESFDFSVLAREKSRRRGPILRARGDSPLIRDARAGNAQALETLLTALSSPVLRFASGFCRHPEDAEEVAQDVMVSIARSLPEFRGEAAIETWAYTVAKNACLRKRRKKVNEPAHLETLDTPATRKERWEGAKSSRSVRDPGLGPHEFLESKELHGVIHQALLELPREQREVVLLRDVEGLSAAEVGEALSISERAVKSRLHRARLRLRDQLLPYLRSGSAPRSRRIPKARAKISCPDTARFLSRALEGELDAGVCARLERHVSACAECQSACDSLKETLQACRFWGAQPLPPEIRRSVRRAIKNVTKSATTRGRRREPGTR